MAKTYDGYDVKESVSQWTNTCTYCSQTSSYSMQKALIFKSPTEFSKHLRNQHCTVEGGSFVCRYGYNGVCPSLPLDGVSDKDYEAHVNKYHIQPSASKEQPIKWSVFSAAQNLPAVLNDPGRGKQTNFFTKKWGDAFVEKTHISPSPYLADIQFNHFDNYLKKIGKRYRRHTRISQTNYELSSQQMSDQLASQLNLKDIPEVFLKHNLELYNPSVFVEVFPGIDDNDPNKQSSRILQEKLSYYLDIVEVQIAKQVSEKSSAFFHAMTTQDAIMERMKEAATNVTKLRNKIKLIDDTVVKESLQIISLERIKSNKTVVLEKLKLMSTVHQTQPMIQLLLSTQDFVAALDLISTTQEILVQELTGVHCFRHLPSQLSEIERLIDKMLTTDFERYTTADLNRPFAAAMGQEKILEEDKLVCIISGLLRKRNLNFIDTYKDEVITTVRAVIKGLMIEVIASSDVEICLTGAGEEAQSLSLSEWVNLLDKATVTLLKLLQRVKLVHDVMQQTADASAGKITDDVTFIDTEAFLSTGDYGIVQSKLYNLLQSVCNYCHERCANLVCNQSLEKCTATADEISKLSDIIEDFCDGCEKICGLQSLPLKLALKAQGSRYAQKFHADRRGKLMLLLESERWKQADVPAEFQRMIDGITKGEFNWSKANEETPQSVLMVDGQPFALVGAALLLVQIVSEYCRCATQLPIISSHLARNVVDLLRTFNSRTCQLVLGAGALHVAGLKTITSGNLALVSRALQLVLWLLPHVKLHFQGLDLKAAGGAGGSTDAILNGYDSVEKHFVSHIKEIEDKVLSIVCDLVSAQLSNWDARPPVPSQSFRNISRQFVKLHEAIATILPEQQVNNIYRIVHRNFKDKLREQLLKNNIMNNGGPQHGVVISELTFYMETLRTLKAIPAVELEDSTLEDIWLK